MSNALKVLVLALAATRAFAAADAAVPAPAPKPLHVSVLTGEQVVQILDETVEWYRTLGAQQQSASQPSDLLILYANRQTADKVVGLAFEIARANAELLSSEAQSADAAGEVTSSAKTLLQLQKQLDGQRQGIKSEMESSRKAAENEKVVELQGELDMVNARINFLDTMTQFVSETDAKGFGASALKAHIDAIAASIPAANAAPPAATTATPAPAAAAAVNLAGGTASGRLGIWDLAGNVLRLSEKVSTIDAIDRRTADLESTFMKIRTPPLEQLKSLSVRGDALAAQADTVSVQALKGVRDQFDTLAWLFKQTSAILLPLSKEGVLLKQYRRNLASWRDTAKTQYHDALKALGIRTGILLAMLAGVFGGAEIWRRAVFRYAHEPRRRYQLLLMQKIATWTLAATIIGLTFATELSSFATFAGLLTAGLAVAMQSVLVSVVGYFFLIGKYGIRVGDRVQIGNVSGEVIDLGLVRMHLMELSGQGPLGPTGRVVAFANSIVFQSSGGLFKQIPGVNFAWHELTLKLPDGCDYTAVKEKLLHALVNVIKDYSDDIVRQTKEIQRTTASNMRGDPTPQIQLHFSAAGVEAVARYPVQLQHESEIDERVSRDLTNVIAALSK
jgi:small-conductance mechanosensitive channel